MRRTIYFAVAGTLAVAGLAWFALRAHSHRGPTPNALRVNASKPDLRPLGYSEPRITLRDLGIEPRDYAGDYTQQKANGFQPREDRAAWPLKLPLDWGADPYKDPNWTFQLHALRILKPIIGQYAKGADPALYREAVGYMLDWWAFHTEQGKTASHSWYDMATGVRATRLAWALDLAFSGKEKLSEAETASLVAMADEHVRRLKDPKFIASSNHGLFQIQGLVALCRVFGESGRCKGAQAFAEKQLRALLDKQFTAEGVHREHSPDYHRLASDAFQPFADPKSSKAANAVASRLELAAAVFPWFVFPSGRLAAFGDTEGTAQPVKPPGARCLDAAKDCVEVGDFSKGGYAVVRSPWSEPAESAFMLIMTGTYFSSTHKHADDLSFELMEGGQMLFVDSGKYAYLKDGMSKFVQSARAHGTVGLTDREIGIRDTKPYESALSKVETAGDTFVLHGEVRREELFSQERTLKYVPGRSLVITDSLKSDQPRKYEAYLHLSPELEPRAADEGFVVPLRNGKNMRIEPLSKGCTASVIRGQRKPQIQGWVTTEYRKMTEASVITFACPGKDRDIEVLVSFDDAARKLALSRQSATSAAPASGTAGGVRAQ